LPAVIAVHSRFEPRILLLGLYVANTTEPQGLRDITAPFVEFLAEIIEAAFEVVEALIVHLKNGADLAKLDQHQIIGFTAHGFHSTHRSWNKRSRRKPKGPARQP
jgi:hypothetical protein